MGGWAARAAAVDTFPTSDNMDAELIWLGKVHTMDCLGRSYWCSCCLWFYSVLLFYLSYYYHREKTRLSYSPQSWNLTEGNIPFFPCLSCLPPSLPSPFLLVASARWSDRTSNKGFEINNLIMSELMFPQDFWRLLSGLLEQSKWGA